VTTAHDEILDVYDALHDAIDGDDPVTNVDGPVYLGPHEAYVIATYESGARVSFTTRDVSS
jgi:hypothetical protein